MDWISTDLAQKVLKNGKKVNFLVIVDRASRFVRVYQLRGTKTKGCLQDFNEVYCGPPYWIISDGVPYLLLKIKQLSSSVRRHQLGTNSAQPLTLKGTEMLSEWFRSAYW